MKAKINIKIRVIKNPNNIQPMKDSINPKYFPLLPFMLLLLNSTHCFPVKLGYLKLIKIDATYEKDCIHNAIFNAFKTMYTNILNSCEGLK